MNLVCLKLQIRTSVPALLNICHYAIIFGLIIWSMYRPGSDLGEKDFYNHLDRFRNGDFDDEMKDNNRNEKSH